MSPWWIPKEILNRHEDTRRTAATITNTRLDQRQASPPSPKREQQASQLYRKRGQAMVRSALPVNKAKPKRNIGAT